MNGNTRIAVYYIATGKYKGLFPEFLESLQNFFPECKKIVKLISDGLEEYRDYEKGNVMVDLCPRINDYPWPVVTLYKMWHIQENYDSSCDYACYFNANAIIYKHSNEVFDLNKITVSYHSFNHKGHDYNSWDYIRINPNSSAYLENDTYEYIQGGFFFGKNDLIYQMCQDITSMVQYDTNRSIIAQWHDESYLNKWCVEHANLVDKKFIMTVYPDTISEERFVFLRRKEDYQIKK